MDTTLGVLLVESHHHSLFLPLTEDGVVAAPGARPTHQDRLVTRFLRCRGLCLLSLLHRQEFAALDDADVQRADALTRLVEAELTLDTLVAADLVELLRDALAGDLRISSIHGLDQQHRPVVGLGTVPLGGFTPLLLVPFRPVLDHRIPLGGDVHTGEVGPLGCVASHLDELGRADGATASHYPLEAHRPGLLGDQPSRNLRTSQQDYVRVALQNLRQLAGEILVVTGVVLHDQVKPCILQRRPLVFAQPLPIGRVVRHGRELGVPLIQQILDDLPLEVRATGRVAENVLAALLGDRVVEPGHHLHHLVLGVDRQGRQRRCGVGEPTDGDHTVFSAQLLSDVHRLRRIRLVVLLDQHQWPAVDTTLGVLLVEGHDHSLFLPLTEDGVVAAPGARPTHQDRLITRFLFLCRWSCFLLFRRRRFGGLRRRAGAGGHEHRHHH